MFQEGGVGLHRKQDDPLEKEKHKKLQFDFVEIVVLLVWELDFVRKESAQDEQLALREELDDEGDQR